MVSEAAERKLEVHTWEGGGMSDGRNFDRFLCGNKSKGGVTNFIGRDSEVLGRHEDEEKIVPC